MSFDLILKELTKNAGAKGAVMLDSDGEIVASHADSPSLEIDLIGAHHGIVLDIIKDATSRSAFSGVRSVAISTVKSRLAISTLKEGYYLLVAMGRSAPMGKALFESRRAVERIEEEMG
ncbi:MAG: roadblock/LC7 domain-containing protein [Deltaproteobacteria bacterium]|nr:roadblock/LC7 domain-containing protein [Deltaproteobacteria bacterium]